MKACAVLAVLLSVAFSGSTNPVPQEDDGTNMEYFLVETEPGVYEMESLVNVEVNVMVSASDVTYYFFSINNPSCGTKIESDNVAALGNTEFSVSKETLFIIHGWRNSNASAFNNNIREAILAKHDINVFVVDWSPVARKVYISAQEAVTNIGDYVADFVRSLVSTYGLSLNQVAFVGHSLGAHVAGNAGASLNGEVDHIVGLDPALPLFSMNNTDKRLDPSDARFVQVIHTSGGLLGFKNSIGDSDFFPNGGSTQPGCGVDLAGSCAHSRSYQYYAESVSASPSLFVSTLCTSQNDFTAGNCNSNIQSVMGGYTIDRIQGDFYLYTNSQSLFARG